MSHQNALHMISTQSPNGLSARRYDTALLSCELWSSICRLSSCHTSTCNTYTCHMSAHILFTSSPNHELPSTTSSAASTNANTFRRIIAEYQAGEGIVAHRDNSKFLRTAREERETRIRHKTPLYNQSSRQSCQSPRGLMKKATPINNICVACM